MLQWKMKTGCSLTGSGNGIWILFFFFKFPDFRFHLLAFKKKKKLNISGTKISIHSLQQMENQLKNERDLNKTISLVLGTFWKFVTTINIYF